MKCRIGIFIFFIFSTLACTTKDDVKPYDDRIIYASLDRYIISDTNTSVYDTLILDLNRDSNPDYLFIYGVNYNYQNIFNSPFFMYAEGVGDNQILLNDFAYDVPCVQPMKLNDDFMGKWGSMQCDFANRPLNLPWEGKGPNYIGFRMKLDNEFVIGWLKMEIGKKGSVIILYDYAFRLDAGHNIKAGQR